MAIRDIRAYWQARDVETRARRAAQTAYRVAKNEAAAEEEAWRVWDIRWGDILATAMADAAAGEQ